MEDNKLIVPEKKEIYLSRKLLRKNHLKNEAQIKTYGCLACGAPMKVPAGTLKLYCNKACRKKGRAKFGAIKLSVLTEKV